MRLPKQLGEITYIIFFPFIYAWLKISKRVYVAVCFDGQVILTQNWLGSNNQWRIPGGGIKRGESAKNAAIRELKEELGLELKASDLIPISARYNNFVFYSVTMASKPILNLKRNEIFAVRYVKIVDIKTIGLDKSSSFALSSLIGASEPNLV